MIVRWNGSTTLPRPREQQKAAAVLKTSRHRWVNFLYFYVSMLRTSEIGCHITFVHFYVSSVRLSPFKCVFIYLEDINTLLFTIVCVFLQFSLLLPCGHLCCAVYYLCLSFRACPLVIRTWYPCGYYLSVYVCLQCRQGLCICLFRVCWYQVDCWCGRVPVFADLKA